jgi:hypothetical protein
MTTRLKKSAQLAALIKKTAQKLVRNPKGIEKELKKLALTLPLMALLVEEVRAAQKKVSIDATSPTGDVFQDEQALADFIKDQNLDDAQYAELQEELDGVNLAKADGQAPAEEDDDKGAYLPHHDGGVGAEKAFGSDAAGGSLAPEAGAEHAAAAVDTNESFELAGLVIPVPPSAFLAAAATAGAAVADIFGGTTGTTTVTPVDTPISVDASGTHLNSSLKDLQKLGVDFVNASAGESTLNVALGDGSFSTTAVSNFGDANHDGIISAAENSALQVNLLAANSTDLHDIAGVASSLNLVGHGIDNIHFNLADQTALNDLLGSNTIAADMTAIKASGLTLDIDMGTAADIHISQAQAELLISEGVHFAQNDHILVDAQSTHLQSSLKDLQKLGVDNVATTLSHLDVDLGTAGTLSSTGIPSFASGVDVSLKVADATGLNEVMGSTQALHTAGIDHIDLASNVGAITQAQASNLIANGIDFAADDSITVNVNVTDAAGLSQILANGAAFNTAGIDHIDLVSNVGVITQAQASSLITNGLNFAADDSITVNVADAKGLTEALANTAAYKAAGIDHIDMTHNVAEIDMLQAGAMAGAGLDFAANDDVTLINSTGTYVTTHVSDLQKLGVDHIHLVDNYTNFNALDAAAQALHDAGLPCSKCSSCHRSMLSSRSSPCSTTHRLSLRGCLAPCWAICARAVWPTYSCPPTATATCLKPSVICTARRLAR